MRLSALITIGRKLREWGQSGVITIADKFADKIGPPAERLYAVEPVGVEIIIPSLMHPASACRPTFIFSSIILNGTPAAMTMSFIAVEQNFVSESFLTQQLIIILF
jgi:hypothetical protein